MAVTNLSDIGSIALHIIENFATIPAGVSGNMIEIVDQARQNVANYVGEEIGSKNIATQFQPPIVSFAKAETIDFVNAEAGGDELRLAELTVGQGGEEMSSQQWRMMGENQLSNIGRKAQFSRSVS